MHRRQPRCTHTPQHTHTHAPRCLEDKAREVNIADLAGFYSSNTFTGAGFQLDRSAGVIVYTV
jgi:hypothetical protein